MIWQNRISNKIKSLVDIDGVAGEYKRIYQKKLAEGLTINFAGRRARVEMLKKLNKIGLLGGEGNFSAAFYRSITLQRMWLL